MKPPPWTNWSDTFSASRGHLLAATGFLLASICLPYFTPPWLAWVLVALIDLYVALMLWAAAQLASHRDSCGKANSAYETWPGMPRRDGALLVLVMLLAATTIAFATLYMQPGWLAESGGIDRLSGLYFSVVTMATVGYGDLKPLSDCAKVAVVVQIVSGLLFLTAAIPILASRLADF
jgi:hypothetical protein